jgi:hypothetical protein
MSLCKTSGLFYYAPYASLNYIYLLFSFNCINYALLSIFFPELAFLASGLSVSFYYLTGVFSFSAVATAGIGFLPITCLLLLIVFMTVGLLINVNTLYLKNASL